MTYIHTLTSLLVMMHIPLFCMQPMDKPTQEIIRRLIDIENSHNVLQFKQVLADIDDHWKNKRNMPMLVQGKVRSLLNNPIVALSLGYEKSIRFMLATGATKFTSAQLNTVQKNWELLQTKPDQQEQLLTMLREHNAIQE